VNLAVIRLHIENAYADGVEIDTESVITVPLPYPDDLNEQSEWEYEHIFPETGAGREGDAVYDVEIVESSTPELLGKTFEFGY
jgi:hypothetical protein